MKNKFKFIAIVIMLLLVSFIGTSLAYFKSDGNGINLISAGSLGVQLEMNVSDKLKDIENFKAVPGSEYEYQLYAKNSGNYDSYIRIILTKYWQNSKGEKIYEADASKIELQMNDLENWIIDNSDINSEVVYCYYKKPLMSKEQTSNVVDAIKISSLNNTDQNLYAGLSAKIDVKVDAIQKVAVKDAVLAEWGMNVELDEAGNIISVEE